MSWHVNTYTWKCVKTWGASRTKPTGESPLACLQELKDNRYTAADKRCRPSVTSREDGELRADLQPYIYKSRHHM